MAVDRTYECAWCGEEFESEWTDEEAEAEYAARFPGHENEPRDMVCHECYKREFPNNG